MKKTIALILTTASLALAGCGNSPEPENAVVAAFKRTLERASAPDAAPTTGQPADPIKATLSATSSPAQFVVVESRKSTAALVQVEVNGPYRTFATSDRQTVTMRDGFVTASRGLVNDLMSASIAPSMSLVKARRSGNVTRVMRYLSGDNRTIELTFDCTIKADGASQRITAGEVNATARMVTETCTGAHDSFTNHYFVTGNGTLVGSRQWISPTLGSILFQPIRL